MQKRTIQQLLQEVANGEIEVAAVNTIETDQGNILDVVIWSMNVGEVLQVNIQIPDELVDAFDFGDGGYKVQKGLQQLTDHLRKKGENDD